jgi:hypothetical protein
LLIIVILLDKEDRLDKNLAEVMVRPKDFLKGPTAKAGITALFRYKKIVTQTTYTRFQRDLLKG